MSRFFPSPVEMRRLAMSNSNYERLLDVLKIRICHAMRQDRNQVSIYFNEFSSKSDEGKIIDQLQTAEYTVTKYSSHHRYNVAWPVDDPKISSR